MATVEVRHGMASGLTDSLITSYCCPNSDKRAPSWKATQDPVASGPGLLSSTGFLSPQPPGVWSGSGPRVFVQEFRFDSESFCKPPVPQPFFDTRSLPHFVLLS